VGYNTYSEVDRMFSAHSVRDLLFGYWDPVLALFSSGDPNVSPFFPGLVKNMTSLANVTGLNTLTTGRDETLPYRGYMRFRGATINTVCRTLPPPCAPTDRVPIWQTLSLSRVQGLDGSQLHPDVSAGESFSFWNAGAMRALRYVNRADGPEPQRTSFKGIATLRFTMDPHEMLNATLFAANAGYYQNEFTGFFNLTRFASLARLFVSKPHFAGVPPPIGTSVVGMSPQLDLHDSFIDVEPITGATMHLLQRSQVNFQMGTMSNMPNASSGQFDGVWFPRLRRPLMMPVVWIEEEGGIDDADAGNFRTQVYGAEFIYELILWGGVALACLCFLVGAPLSVRAALHLWRFRPQLTYSKRPGDDDAAAEVERASLVRGDAAAAAAGLADAPASDASPASYGATDASYKEPVDISYDR
jgi:lysosome membrane protein 2